jgi:hypothetical protein
MPGPLSAIDAVSPAFERTKRQLFQPFRLAFWLRMAIVALTTGEFYGNSGWSGFHYAVPSSRGSSHLGLPGLGLVTPNLEYLKRYLPWIVAAAVLLFVALIFWMYVSSVLRFILFDAVLTEQCQIKRDWRRWRSQGIRFFLWRICFSLAVIAALAILVAATALTALGSGAFANPRQHIALLVLGGIGVFIVLVCLMILAALIAMFARDFVVPVMALENLGVVDGWQRVMRMLNVEKGAYGGYVLMKIVLVVGSAILFGVLTLLAVIALLIPLSIAGYAGYAFAKSAALLWKTPVVMVCILFAEAALGLIFYTIAFVSAPAMVFFQAYAIHFLGSRYPVLENRLSASPGAPPLSPAV